MCGINTLSPPNSHFNLKADICKVTLVVFIGFEFKVPEKGAHKEEEREQEEAAAGRLHAGCGGDEKMEKWEKQRMGKKWPR